MKEKDDFNKLFTKLLDEQLKRVFGAPATSIIYNHLERNYSLKREEIPEKLEAFNTGLTEFLSSGAQVIQKMILEKLYSHTGIKHQIREGYSFVDYVTEVRNQL